MPICHEKWLCWTVLDQYLKSCVQTCSCYHIIYVKRFTGPELLSFRCLWKLSFFSFWLSFFHGASLLPPVLAKKYQDPECTSRSSLPLTASPGTTPSPAQTCLLITVDVSLLARCAYLGSCSLLFQICSNFLDWSWLWLTVLSDGCWTCDAGVGCCCSYHPCCVHLVWDWRICALLVVLLHCLRCGHLHSTAVLLFQRCSLLNLWTAVC